jgi:hypothetical protein
LLPRSAPAAEHWFPGRSRIHDPPLLFSATIIKRPTSLIWVLINSGNTCQIKKEFPFYRSLKLLFPLEWVSDL